MKQGASSLGQDVEILRRFLAGNPQAARQVERWAREIVRLRHHLIQRDEVDDVIQETLISLWRSCARPDFELRVGLRPLVRSIAVARCIDARRRRREQIPLDESVADSRTPPGAWTSGDLEMVALRRALLALASRCRDVIRLHFIEGLSYREMAPRLDRSEPTLRVEMFRCMKQLRALLEETPQGRAATPSSDARDG